CDAHTLPLSRSLLRYRFRVPFYRRRSVVLPSAPPTPPLFPYTRSSDLGSRTAAAIASAPSRSHDGCSSSVSICRIAKRAHRSVAALIASPESSRVTASFGSGRRGLAPQPPLESIARPPPLIPCSSYSAKMPGVGRK